MVLTSLSMLFVTCLIVSNIIATKIISIGNWITPAGVIAYPLTFLFTDVISELYGKKIASKVVWAGFGANILMLSLIFFSKLLPPAPFWKGQAAYETSLSMVPRIVLASMIAYLVSQHHDVFAFDFWKRKTNGKYLWLRNNASTMVSQAIDTVIFIIVAFWKVIPTEILLNMIFSQYIIKVIIAAGDTPFCYLLVGLLKKKIKKPMLSKSH